MNRKSRPAQVKRSSRFFENLGDFLTNRAARNSQQLQAAGFHLQVTVYGPQLRSA
jgi:hypothetical protein